MACLAVGSNELGGVKMLRGFLAFACLVLGFIGRP